MRHRKLTTSQGDRRRSIKGAEQVLWLFGSRGETAAQMKDGVEELQEYQPKGGDALVLSFTTNSGFIQIVSTFTI